MNTIPEELNEQCTECKRWGDILVRSTKGVYDPAMGLAAYSVRLCRDCVGKALFMSDEARDQYLTSLHQKLLLELIQPGGNA